MDLLGCAECEHRFYVSEMASADVLLCPQCGGGLTLAARGLASIPLDARWLDPRAVPEIEVAVVELHRKREPSTENGQRIVGSLADYFPVRANGPEVEVSVNRGEAAEAGRRVAAILDGIDSGWEEHFYLAATDPRVPSDDLRRPPARRRTDLHLVRRGDEDASREQWA
jgi:hypothetical protein